jgi:hypothetical protein
MSTLGRFSARPATGRLENVSRIGHKLCDSLLEILVVSGESCIGDVVTFQVESGDENYPLKWLGQFWTGHTQLDAPQTKVIA